jgi:hypothetical protein
LDGNCRHRSGVRITNFRRKERAPEAKKIRTLTRGEPHEISGKQFLENYSSWLAHLTFFVKVGTTRSAVTDFS